MLNSDKFLNAYSTIENYLRKKSGNDKFLKSFNQMVDQLCSSNPVIKRFANDLKKYHNLRNVMVHEKKIICEPNDRTVEQIYKIELFLIKPPTIFPLFKTIVITIDKSDSVAYAVELMYKNTISQIPVKNGSQFISLLTTNTIARWLGAFSKKDISILEETSVAQVLQYTEDIDNYYFMAKNTNIFETLEKFQEYERKGKRLESIIITESGKATENIIGIMTIADLPRALGEIEKI